MCWLAKKGSINFLPIFFRLYKKHQGTRRSSPRPLFFHSRPSPTSFPAWHFKYVRGSVQYGHVPTFLPPPISSGRAEPNFLTWHTGIAKTGHAVFFGTVEMKAFGENLRPIPLFPGHIGVCSGPPPSFCSLDCRAEKKGFFHIASGEDGGWERK